LSGQTIPALAKLLTGSKTVAEDLQFTAQREVLEETGISATLDELTG
jgi:8-oxo-dGTP pyrophosphatase MutT (NUDIX family)